MTLEMIIHSLYLATGDEKTDANLCKSIKKKSASLLPLRSMEVANIEEVYGIVTPVE